MTPYHPQGNGAVEHINHTLKRESCDERRYGKKVLGGGGHQHGMQQLEESGTRDDLPEAMLRRLPKDGFIRFLDRVPDSTETKSTEPYFFF